jgi:hypothetical protein
MLTSSQVSARTAVANKNTTTATISSDAASFDASLNWFSRGLASHVFLLRLASNQSPIFFGRGDTDYLGFKCVHVTVRI